MSIENPFFHRGAIRRAKDFYGRQAEIDQILGLLRNGQSVSLIGPRRIGKSSVLLHLRRPEVRAKHQIDSPHAIFIMVDCQELGGSPPEDVYDALLTSLIDAAAAAGIDLGDAVDPGTYRALDRALNKVTQSDVAVVVLLDEFELLAANSLLTPYFFARLRGLTTKYGLAYITASQKPLFAITADEQILSSPFFNIFVTMPLGLYTQVEAKGLIAARLEGSNVQFAPGLTDYLLHLVGYHPFFIHIAGYHALQAIIQGEELQTEASWAQLTGPIEVEAASHLGYLWHNLEPDEQYALAIADGPIDNLRLLEQQCLLQSNEAGYHYTSDILHRFVRRQEVAGIIQAGPFIIDPQRHQVKVFGRELNLTTSQFDIMVCLANNVGNVVHGDDLELAVWREVLVDDPDRLKTLIKRLRRAIEPYGNWVVSERGVGYALRPPDF